jgi:CrcB protein
MIKLLNLAIGGMTGTIARYVFSGAMYRLCGTNFPYGTFAVNITGCLLLGIFIGVSDRKWLLDPNARILLMVGFCGAFTTFSTRIVETANMLKDGEIVKAFSNIFLSVVIGIIILGFGMFIGEAI